MLKKAFILLVIILVVGGVIVLNKQKPSTTKPSSAKEMKVSSNKNSTASSMVTTTESGTMQASPAAAKSKEATVTLTTNGFFPSTLTVKVGTKVTWINKEGETATVHSDPHPVHTAYQPLNLGTFADGESLSLTFDTPDTYGYHNHLNPSQAGKVIVQK